VPNKIIVFFLLSFYILLLTGCNDSPSDLGSNLVSQDGVNVVKFNSATDSIFQSSSSFKYVYSLASSSIILLGQAENVNSKILMKFVFAFPDSVKQDIINNNIVVKDSWIEMFKAYQFGDSTAFFDYDVYKVNNFWTSSFSADSFATLSYDIIDKSSNHQIENDTIYSFGIDNSLALPWLQNYSDTLLGSNNGILISPKLNTNQVVGFTAYNFNAVNDPRLKIVFEKTGSYTDTITGYVSSDISIVLGNLPSVGIENIAIQSSLTSEVNLFYDFSKIPKDAVINSAKLTLYVDTLETKTGSTYLNSLRVYLFADTTSYLLNSNFVSVLNRSGATFSGDITGLVRAIHGGIDNLGFLVKAANEIDGVEIFALKGSNAADVAKRPNLEIVYSRKK
jgi:hypothetical protein